MFDSIPREMRRVPQWICWQLKDASGGKGGNKQTKGPFHVDGRPVFRDHGVVLALLQLPDASSFGSIWQIDLVNPCPIC